MHPTQPRQPGTARVLLIEADAGARDALRRELIDAGHEVISAADLDEGLRDLAQPVDLVLLGRASGDRAPHELLGSLHDAAGPVPPACVLLVRDGDQRALEGLGEGAVDFLAWPAPQGHASERVRLALDAAHRTASARTCVCAPEKMLDHEGFVRHLERCLAAAGSRAKHVGVLSIDLSQIKVLTGALTHEPGSELLGRVVARLREGLRRDDLFGSLRDEDGGTSMARLRSEELTLLLPELDQPKDALEIGRRLLQLTNEPFLVGGQEVFVTVSIGVACSPDDGVRAEELLEHAATANLCARQQGRQTLMPYTASMDARVSERFSLEAGLRQAIERDELIVHYQPRVDVASGRILGLEALVRWRHPEKGIISPVRFIPVAEETGLIVPIGAWVLHKACEQTRAWQEAGLPPLRVSVNISAVQFRQPDLYERVMDTLDRTRLEPQWLELELTESLLMQNPEDVVVLLERLSEQGVSLAIDDFGTGYSSLAYLRRFPIDSLKIDRTFIRELTTNPDDAAIATSIILMGKALRLNVVAEGVETRSQLSFLRVMKCQEAQGFLFSPPLPATDVERLLRQGGMLLDEAA